jgi:hypothetical protein
MGQRISYNNDSPLAGKGNVMPVHDWTRVEAGIFHHFHHAWIEEIARALNRGLLPPGFYALAEQIAGGVGPDVLALEAPKNGPGKDVGADHAGGVGLATAPPKAQFHARAEIDEYATKAKVIGIHHVSDHEIVAMVEIVSPGNKKSRHGLRAFVGKAEEVLRAGVHLLIVDLFPPSPRDPQGVPKAVWDEFLDNKFILSHEKPLSLGAFIGSPVPEVFIEPTGVGATLPEMPLFLTPKEYVRVPLEATYQSAWEAVPEFWRNQLSGAGDSQTTSTP